MNRELTEFIRKWFTAPDLEEVDYDESFVTVHRGKIVGHLGMNYKVLYAPDDELGRGAHDSHVAELTAAVVDVEYRGSGIMHGLKGQAHHRAHRLDLPFVVSLSRWPLRQERYGYRPAPNWHEYGMYLQLSGIPWPKGKVEVKR